MTRRAIRGTNRRAHVVRLARWFASRWLPLTGTRDHAYRALASLDVSARVIADAAGVSRRTVRAALAVPYPIPSRVLAEALAAVRDLEMP